MVVKGGTVAEAAFTRPSEFKEWTKDYYWIGGEPTWKSTKGSDFEAVKRGVASITPIKMDFTNLEMVDKLSQLDIKI